VGGGNVISPERRALDIYGSLLAEREAWGGTLVLCCGNVSLFLGAPTAVCIAGGTALVIGASDSSIRSSQRDGGLDFVVRTLDEALRTLKNCVREKRALSVGLMGNAEAILKEMVERGVAPEYVAFDGGFDPRQLEAGRMLIEGGAKPLDLIEMDEDEPRLTAWLAGRGWTKVSSKADGTALKAWNERLLEVLPKEDEVRRRWLRRLPLYMRFARNGVHYVWLSAEEEQAIRTTE
jgi:Urocanase Rossmann-like domain